MASFQTAAEREHKERLLETRKDQQDQLKAVVDGLDTGVFGLVRDVRSVAEDEDLTDTEKVARVRGLLERGQTVAFESLKADLAESGQDRSWLAPSDSLYVEPR